MYIDTTKNDKLYTQYTRINYETCMIKHRLYHLDQLFSITTTEYYIGRYENTHTALLYLNIYSPSSIPISDYRF